MSIIDGIAVPVLWERYVRSVDTSDLETAVLLGTAIEERASQDTELAKHITEPSVVKHLQDLLVERFDINPRMMMLNKPVPHRQTRAILIMRAINNAVRRKFQ